MTMGLWQYMTVMEGRSITRGATLMEMDFYALVPTHEHQH